VVIPEDTATAVSSVAKTGVWNTMEAEIPIARSAVVILDFFMINGTPV